MKFYLIQSRLLQPGAEWFTSCTIQFRTLEAAQKWIAKPHHDSTNYEHRVIHVQIISIIEKGVQ